MTGIFNREERAALADIILIKMEYAEEHSRVISYPATVREAWVKEYLFLKELRNKINTSG